MGQRCTRVTVLGHRIAPMVACKMSDRRLLMYEPLPLGGLHSPKFATTSFFVLNSPFTIGLDKTNA
jgi:hypothetical protein